MYINIVCQEVYSVYGVYAYIDILYIICTVSSRDESHLEGFLFIKVKQRLFFEIYLHF